MDEYQPLQLDIESIIKSKAPKLGKRLPSFIYRFMERTICQKQMNHILKIYPGGTGVDFAHHLLNELNVKIELVGEENIPDEGRFTFASNHPLGGLDGVSLVSALGSRYDSNMKVLVNDLLMNVQPLASVFLPINKHGAQAKGAMETLNKVYESDEQVVMFPAGLVSRLQPHGIADLEWKKAFITKTVQYQRDVIPVYFEGENSKFFYRIARWRKKLRVPFNIEMIYLPSEMFKCKNKTFTIHFGKPIPWQTFDNSKSPAQWAEFVKKEVYKMKPQQASK